MFAGWLVCKMDHTKTAIKILIKLEIVGLGPK